MDVELNVRYLEARSEVVHAFCSHDKVRKFFGDLLKDVLLEDGIQRMGAWAEKMGPQVAEPFKGIEVKKNMPPSWAEIVESP